jgi:hypothetical protein
MGVSPEKAPKREGSRILEQADYTIRRIPKVREADEEIRTEIKDFRVFSPYPSGLLRVLRG